MIPPAYRRERPAGDRTPAVRFAGPEEYVDGSVPLSLRLDELRQRRVKDGTHLWAVGLLYRVPDPGIPVDDLTCGAGNFLGAHQMLCLWCMQPYVSRTEPGECTG
jgi:hypothetical protein